MLSFNHPLNPQDENRYYFHKKKPSFRDLWRITQVCSLSKQQAHNPFAPQQGIDTMPQNLTGVQRDLCIRKGVMEV